ncbi:MAG: TylF/MycF/NovP-related O-methyltransferase [Desulfuromonadales bacterium]
MQFPVQFPHKPFLSVPTPTATEFGGLQVLTTDSLGNFRMDKEPQYIPSLDYSKYLSLIDVRRLLLYVDTLRKLENVSGDIVEVGVFRGNNLKQLALAMSLVEPEGCRNIVGFDTFKGFLPEQVHLAQEKDKIAMFDNPEGTDNLQATLSKLVNIPRQVKLVIGDVMETFGQFYENWGNRIALAYIDVDLELPTYSVLSVLAERLSVGGIILLDQYSRDGWGETRAVDAFRSTQASRFEFMRIPNSIAPTALLRKLCD